MPATLIADYPSHSTVSGPIASTRAVATALIDASSSADERAFMACLKARASAKGKPLHVRTVFRSSKLEQKINFFSNKKLIFSPHLSLFRTHSAFRSSTACRSISSLSFTPWWRVAVSKASLTARSESADCKKACCVPPLTPALSASAVALRCL
jgi:hypothetical protein